MCLSRMTRECISVGLSATRKVTLLDSQTINFGPAPNITNQPLPTHGGSTVSAIIEDKSLDLVMDVDQLTTPLVIRESAIDE